MKEALHGAQIKEVLRPMSVSELTVYYLKSARGKSLMVAEVGPRGIAHDRTFTAIDAQTSDGTFRSQRDDKALALITPELFEDRLLLNAPGMNQLIIPVIRRGHLVPVRVHNSKTVGVDQGDVAAQWLTEFLNRYKKPTESEKLTRLVRMPDDQVRPVSPNRAITPKDEVAYSDGAPLLLISQESLDDLNARLAKKGLVPLPMNRFRPNIVISGGGLPNDEDRIDRIKIGRVWYKIAWPCARCAIPTTDQESLKRTSEPTRTLLEYRPSNEEGAPYFGQNVIPILEPGQKARLRVGDFIEEVRYKEAP